MSQHYRPSVWWTYWCSCPWEQPDSPRRRSDDPFSSLSTSRPTRITSWWSARSWNTTVSHFVQQMREYFGLDEKITYLFLSLEPLSIQEIAIYIFPACGCTCIYSFPFSNCAFAGYSTTATKLITVNRLSSVQRGTTMLQWREWPSLRTPSMPGWMWRSLSKRAPTVS